MTAKEESVPPEHLRCQRSDGRKWRCRRRVMENQKLCEIHQLQQRLRHNKQKVPDSLKLLRTQIKLQHKNNNHHHHHIAAAHCNNANKFRIVKKKKKNPNLSSDRNYLNDIDMEGEDEGSGSTTVDITGYDLENRISKLEKLIAKFKVAKLASKAWKIDKQFL